MSLNYFFPFYNFVLYSLSQATFIHNKIDYRLQYGLPIYNSNEIVVEYHRYVILVVTVMII